MRFIRVVDHARYVYRHHSPEDIKRLIFFDKLAMSGAADPLLSSLQALDGPQTVLHLSEGFCIVTMPIPVLR